MEIAKELSRRLHWIEAAVETSLDSRDKSLDKPKRVTVDADIDTALPRQLYVLLHGAMQLDEAAGERGELSDNAPPCCAEFAERSEVRAGRDETRVLFICDTAFGTAQPAHHYCILHFLAMRPQREAVGTDPLRLHLRIVLIARTVEGNIGMGRRNDIDSHLADTLEVCFVKLPMKWVVGNNLDRRARKSQTAAL